MNSTLTVREQPCGLRARPSLAHRPAPNSGQPALKHAAKSSLFFTAALRAAQPGPPYSAGIPPPISPKQRSAAKTATICLFFPAENSIKGNSDFSPVQSRGSSTSILLPCCKHTNSRKVMPLFQKWDCGLKPRLRETCSQVRQGSL